MAELMDAAYKRIEDAIASGKDVEHCSINQDGGVEQWTKWMGSDVRRWHPSRYRIDEEDVWSQDMYGDSPLEIIAPDIQMLKMLEEIVRQNSMILEAFATPRIVVKRPKDREEGA